MLLRTTQTASHRRAQYGTGALIVAQWIASTVLLTADCSFRNELSWHMRSSNPECPKELLRWQVITALDLITEAALLFLPIQLIWNLQMSARNKFIVVLAFWLRIPTIIFSVLRYNQTQMLTTTSDVSLTAAIVVIWQAVQLSYSLAAVTIATLKQFTESLNTGFGHGELMRVHGSSQAYKMSDRSATLKDTKASDTSTSRSKKLEPHVASISAPQSTYPTRKSSLKAQNEGLKLRPENLRNTAIISSPPKESGMESRSIHSGGSQDNIIRQEVQYSVHYDEAPLVQECHR
ncbi:Nn.00g067130.m01.CDS01 [Neocucurbitaria sp. VM-36]